LESLSRLQEIISLEHEGRIL